MLRDKYILAINKRVTKRAKKKKKRQKKEFKLCPCVQFITTHHKENLNIKQPAGTSKYVLHVLIIAHICGLWVLKPEV